MENITELCESMENVKRISVSPKKFTNPQELKNQRKIAKKEIKKMKMCEEQFQLSLSSTPSKWVLVWGLGLAMGTTKEKIRDTFKAAITEIRMYFNKPITCILFEKIEDSITAKTKLSGKEEVDDQIVYMGYIQEPKEEDIEQVYYYQQKVPEGLVVIPDYISEEEENALLAEIIPQDLSNCGTGLKNRWVRHYGYDFRYGRNDVDTDVPLQTEMPESISAVASKMLNDNIVKEVPQQVTVNHYLPGQGIPQHVDTHSPFDEPIISLSLLSPVVMDFRREKERFSLLLKPRSLLLMKASSRYEWTHSIASRKFDVILSEAGDGFNCLPREVRVSLTFRILRESKICNCIYPNLCDSQKGKISADNATELESTLVHKVYEEIAGHFSDTRHTPWPKVEKFVSTLESGSIVLDVGCGNGKYFGLNTGIVEIGSDMSKGLLLKSKQKNRNSDAIRSNALNLPFKDSSVDVVICIAVLHHLSTKERRVEALKEITRVLRQNGRALIYVWAKEQKKCDTTSTYGEKQEKREKVYSYENYDVAMTDWSFIPVYNYETNFSNNDMLVPWVQENKNERSVRHRYYHVFSLGELESLIQELQPTPIIIESYYDEGNWCLHLEKSS